MDHQQHHNQVQQATSLAHRPPLASSLRWLQACLLLLFGHDVLCFSLGYPFLPSVFGGAATGLAFSCYGLASIAVLLLLLLCSSSNSSSSSGASSSSRAVSKFWRILSAAALAAAAGAANAALPGSYGMLLLTKATQGAASALYFCDSLSLVAAVFPRSYRPQAMAFISAGLTAGDALGPVLGGLVFQAAGLQAALALQPAASLAAVAAWGLLLLWPRGRRPWGRQQAAAAAGAAAGAQEGRHELRQKQQRQHAAPEEGGVPDRGLREPLLLLGSQQDALRSAEAAYQQQATVSATAAAGAGSEQAGHSRLQLLRQLLRRPAILSLCVLALTAQAARTAVDLLLPMLLQDWVGPGVIGLLFIGEAVGSVVAPFAVDVLLSRHNSSSSGSSSSESSSSNAANSTGESSSRGQKAAVAARGGASCCKTGNTHSSSVQCASWLLLLSAAGMAVCCVCVLTLWQLPAALQGSIPRLNPAADLQSAQQEGTLLAAVGRAEWALQPSSRPGQGVAGVVNCSLVGWAASLSCVANGIVALKALQHTPCMGASLLLSAAPPANIDVAAAPSDAPFGVGFDGVRHPAARLVAAPPSLGGVGGGAVFVSDGAASGTQSFGLVELLVIGAVLALLGAWHSSCETLIYTVLTDIIAPSSSSSGCVGSGVESEAGSQPGSKGVYVAAGSLVAASAGAAAAANDAAGDGCGAAAVVEAPSGRADSSSSCGSECDIEVDVGEVSDSQPTPSGAGDSSPDADCHMGCKAHSSCVAEAATLLAVCETPTPLCASSQQQDDCTEVVMVLYVLFWVVGFSVGAGAVALLPGTELPQLQALAAVFGVLLGAAGRWTWLAVAG